MQTKNPKVFYIWTFWDSLAHRGLGVAGWEAVGSETQLLLCVGVTKGQCHWRGSVLSTTYTPKPLSSDTARGSMGPLVLGCFRVKITNPCISSSMS